MKNRLLFIGLQFGEFGHSIGTSYGWGVTTKTGSFGLIKMWMFQVEDGLII